jgi:hypothetical protein
MNAIQTTGQYAVGWSTLLLINAGLAQSKDRSGLEWWLTSLFLGPICTLLIVILEPIHGGPPGTPPEWLGSQCGPPQ